jgi:acyl-CoA thioester hydrolase
MSARTDPARRVLENYPERMPMQLRFGDCDMQGHLNNAAAARLYEEARIRFLRRLMGEATERLPRPPVVAHLAIDYLGEGEYPGDLMVGVGILGVGRTSWRVGKGLFQDGRCIGLCEAVLVGMADTGPTTLPTGFRTLLERYSIAA